MLAFRLVVLGLVAVGNRSVTTIRLLSLKSEYPVRFY